MIKTQIVELINTNTENFALILRALLDRIPIIVFGENDEEINEIIDELTSLIKNRQELIFYTDFISKSELENILQLESVDFDSKRILIKSPPAVTFKAVEVFDEFKAWVFGYNTSLDDLEKKSYLFKNLTKKTDYFLSLKIEKGSKMVVNMEGKNAKILDINFEKTMIREVMSNTEIAIEKMVRILRKKIPTSSIDSNSILNLLNFRLEENRVKRNLLEKQILDFINAAGRAFALLTRINQLNEMGVPFEISEKTIQKTIMFEECRLKRIFEFIEREWNENYTPEIKLNKSSEFADIIEGLWG